MSKEIERRFRIFDASKLPKKTAEYMFEIIVMEPLKVGQMIRLRKEGDKNTFTIKQKNPGESFPTEWETTIGDIHMAEHMLIELGVKHQYNLQKHRDVYVMKSSKGANVEIAVDEYPGLPPYIEIEGPTEESIKEIASVLGANWDESDFSASTLYNEIYGIPSDKKIRPDDDLNFTTAHEKMLPFIATKALAKEFNERLVEQQTKFGMRGGKRKTLKRHKSRNPLKISLKKFKKG